MPETFTGMLLTQPGGRHESTRFVAVVESKLETTTWQAKGKRVKVQKSWPRKENWKSTMKKN